MSIFVFYGKEFYIMAKKENNFQDMSSYSSKSGHKKAKAKKSKKHIVAKVLICFFSVILILVGGAALYVSNYVLAGLTSTVITTDKEVLGITSEAAEVAEENPEITNIALFGVDSRYNTFNGLSDAIMILTIDEAHNKIKLTSILRDSRVNIGTEDRVYMNKINAAYSYYGAEGGIRAINQNFGMNIEDYVTVNFNSLADIVDAFGGVEIDVTYSEMLAVNTNLSNVGKSGYLSNYGLVTLTGDQAVAYSRIRSIGSDTERAERQQEVLSSIIYKLPNIPAGDFPDLVNDLSYMCETSLDVTEILGYVPFAAGGFTLETMSMPDTDQDISLTSGTDSATGGWMWFYDLDAATDVIHDFIYEDAPSNTADVDSEA